MSNYSEMLRDPRWQRKRLKIMERDDWTCQYCGNKNDTLNVHHKYYRAGITPWEYEDNAYVCLCETCHKFIAERQQIINEKMAEMQLIIYTLMADAMRKPSKFYKKALDTFLPDFGINK